MDRIDLIIDMPRVKQSDFLGESPKKPQVENKHILERVIRCHKRQLDRNPHQMLNGNLQGSELIQSTWGMLDTASQNIAKKMFESGILSARGYTNLVKVARTIADSNDDHAITADHILEAVQFRSSAYIKRLTMS